MPYSRAKPLPQNIGSAASRKRNENWVCWEWFSTGVRHLILSSAPSMLLLMMNQHPQRERQRGGTNEHDGYDADEELDNTSKIVRRH